MGPFGKVVQLSRKREVEDAIFSVPGSMSLILVGLTCSKPCVGQEAILSTENVCHLYRQANQGASAWNRDDSCAIPRVEYFLDSSYRQNNFICCGGGATSPTTNADIPAGLELRVSGGHYWSVYGPKLVAGTFYLHTYFGPEPAPGPGCNVDVQVWAHYRVVPAAAKASDGSGAGGTGSNPNGKQPEKRPSEDEKTDSGVSSLGLDKILAFCFGVFFALNLLFIAFKDRQPTQMGILIYRVVLAQVAAGIGAVIPGMIDVNVQPVIRAGGAIALFVIVFWFNPPNLVSGSSKPGP